MAVPAMKPDLVSDDQEPSERMGRKKSVKKRTSWSISQPIVVKKEPQEAKDLQGVLGSIQRLLPKDTVMDLREAAENVRAIQGIVIAAEVLSQHHRCVIAPAGIAVAAVFFWLSDFHSMALQAAFILFTAVQLLPHTMAGRILKAVWLWVQVKRLPKVLPASALTGPVFQRRLSVGLWPDSGAINSHMYEVTTFNTFSWCKNCGGFLWGIKEQGLVCRQCERAVCRRCAATGGYCPQVALPA
mmetsp:Transcript_46314/g.100707  ORF Transcript_46314/g.100707 Transcript_46314/m.100707 type:complete len:242 (+) Transcript_46314:816-1541(+)